MREPLIIFVAGIPKGQPRVKARRFGNRAAVYDPGTAEEWKGLVRMETAAKWDKAPFAGPVELGLHFVFGRPKAHLRKDGTEKHWAPVHHTSRPDSDNLAKAVMDALTNLGLWKDDAQIARLVVSKKYTVGGFAGCCIEVRELDNTP